MNKYSIKNVNIDFNFIQAEHIVRGSRRKRLVISN